MTSALHRLFLAVWVMFTGLLLPGLAAAYLDLAAASVEKLDNGLTVIVLEDPSFPVVSVQMLYRSGAVDEVSGKTGLAHFLEHMAFRDSRNFPDTGMVASIDAVGGEWHGYTWLDQTTYFATVPAADFGLLLRIEADRMARLEIPAASVEAEAGAILSEMHGYENDPASVLQDNVLYLKFLAHPYRNNTIGWESDVLGITRQDLAGFYQAHYRPGNAVLAVAGDVRRDEVMLQVRQLFGPLNDRPAPTVPYTAEPVQRGERRVVIHGEVDRKYFKFAYPAPPVSSPDYAAFLLTQELLSAGSGINFLQNDWGTPARPGSALGGITEDLATWFPPSEQEYVFTIAGTLPADGDEAGLESAIDAGIDALGESFSAPAPGAVEALEQARERVLRELAFDVQTTEDAAHQLAFFAGLGALDVLTGLPRALNVVSAADISRVIDQYLEKDQRVVGWYLPSGQTKSGRYTGAATVTPEVKPQAAEPLPVAKTPVAPARTERLENGTPVILKHSGASPTAVLKVLVPAAGYVLPADVTSDEPAWGLVALNFEVLADKIGPAISLARRILETAGPAPEPLEVDVDDPDALFGYYKRKLLNLNPPAQAGPGAPLLLVVSGDIEPETVLQQLEAGFGDLPAGTWRVPGAVGASLPVEVEARLRHPVAQERLAYVVRVSGPRPQAAAAWQVALYILSHGYEGRLGKEAINRQGLVYYIDSAYQTDGGNDWIVLQTGVDPANMPAMERLLKAQLGRLLTDPPSGQEMEEARTHLLGRFISASQSNQELADDLARQWIWYRKVLSVEERAQQLDGVRYEDVLGLLPEFTRGSIIKVRNPDE